MHLRARLHASQYGGGLRFFGSVYSQKSHAVYMSERSEISERSSFWLGENYRTQISVPCKRVYFFSTRGGRSIFYGPMSTDLKLIYWNGFF